MLNEIDETLRELKEKEGDPASIFPRIMDKAGRLIADLFGVRGDEVAVLLVDRETTMFRFAYPDNLFKAAMNTFPVNSASIAGRTIRAKKAQAYNDVPGVRHLGVYERIRSADGPPQDIQKMMSAPIIMPDETPVGVIQVSRKGKTLEDAGPDFSNADLARLSEACRALAVRIGSIIPKEF